MHKKKFTLPEMETQPNLDTIAKNSKTLWETEEIYKYNPNSGKTVFSVDTPPPYVSASHLHVGHAMSYTQAEIIVRYQRMKGKEIFYPMGFDDNGLPTERHVEKVHNIKDKSQVNRSHFRKLCMEETQAGAKTYEDLWRAMGVSVDWTLRYSTIDKRCQRVGQLSFIDLYNKGLLYRSDEPVLWDTQFQTALAQADLDNIERKGKMFDIIFKAAENDADLIISTTRPELIPGCVGLFFNPEDTRYQHLKGTNAVAPIFGQNVPILTSDKVDPEFGTGLMMVCTFGDSEDVEKWKEHKLETRICISPNGKMTELAGDYVGLPVEEARSKIVKDMKALGVVVGEKTVKQNVSVGERSERPVEFHMAPQWFIKILDNQDKFLARVEELNWFPDYMKTRLINWIDGLKYDWNISRQRYYGVPIPVWYVLDDAGDVADVIVADEKDLPVDPTETDPPAWAQEKYAGKKIVPETDVLDTWMTSSVTPQINANWSSLDEDLTDTGIFPMDLRVQAHEIIRTWLFYTLIKSEYHTESLPWKNAMISGWGLNEQGKKISKRSLEKETDTNGFNRYNPDHLIEKYGADAIRYWSAGAKLGQDLKFSEKEVRRGKSVVTKLWNASRMAFTYMEGFDVETDYVPYEKRTLEDQWVVSELNNVVAEVSKLFDKFDYATALSTLDRFFFMTYCDTYLEMIKLRFFDESVWDKQEIQSTQSTLLDCTRMLLSLFAPIMPFVTEELYQRADKFGEEYKSLHASPWPTFNENISFDKQDQMNAIIWSIEEVRKARSAQKIGAASILENVTLHTNDEVLHTILHSLNKNILTAVRAKRITLNLGEGENVVS